MRTGPCDWPLADGCAALDELVDGEDDTVRDLLVASAVEFLWNWTGRRFGLCDTTVRPVCIDRTGTTWRGPTPSTFWLYECCPHLPPDDRCACQDVYDVGLPPPVYDVVSVQVDGDVVDPAAYEVRNGRRLVRVDGDVWPADNDPQVTDGQPGSWSVTYRRGVPVPSGGQVAAATLACELAKAYQQAPDCRLPQRVQTITREGVTVGLLDPFDGLTDGRTGIWTVDSWVSSIMHPRRRSRVVSPDVKPPLLGPA